MFNAFEGISNLWGHAKLKLRNCPRVDTLNFRDCLRIEEEHSTNGKRQQTEQLNLIARKALLKKLNSSPSNCEKQTLHPFKKVDSVRNRISLQLHAQIYGKKN